MKAWLMIVFSALSVTAAAAEPERIQDSGVSSSKLSAFSQNESPSAKAIGSFFPDDTYIHVLWKRNCVPAVYGEYYYEALLTKGPSIDGPRVEADRIDLTYWLDRTNKSKRCAPASNCSETVKEVSLMCKKACTEGVGAREWNGCIHIKLPDGQEFDACGDWFDSRSAATGNAPCWSQ